MGGQKGFGLGPKRGIIRFSHALHLFLINNGGCRTDLGSPATDMGASETRSTQSRDVDDEAQSVEVDSSMV